MTGCRVGAKNTLDRNYLYLAEKLGVEVRPETEVTAVRALDGGGYAIETKPTFASGPSHDDLRAPGSIFAGGVMGTLPAPARDEGRSRAASRSSPIASATSCARTTRRSSASSPHATTRTSRKGVAITSILHTDEHSHLEPVRYAPGSGFFRTLAHAAHDRAERASSRLANALRGFARHPLRLWLRAFFVRDFAKQTQILLYMRTLEGTICDAPRAQPPHRLHARARLAAHARRRRAHGVHARGDRPREALRREGRRRRR